MEKIQLGSSSLRVSRLGLGSMAFSDYYGNRPDEQASIKTLNQILDLGVNFFDTADIYGCGHNEKLIGRAFAKRRDEIILATKFGFTHDQNQRISGLDCSPAYLKKCCDRSLQRLGMETIDLYYAHRIDPHVPVEETVGAMKELVEAGKVRYLGLSEASSDELRRAQAVHPITALQSEYSMWSREPEVDTLTTSKELNIAFVAYSPLGRGFLAGAVPSREVLVETDFRRTLPRFQDEALEQNKVFLELVDTLAEEQNISRAQVALAWVLSQSDHIVPIPGTISSARMAENLGALEVHFSKEALASIGERLPTAVGGRYEDETY